MPSLTNVYLTENSFRYLSDITIRGSTHFIPLSRIDIGELYLFIPFTSYAHCMNILLGSDEVTDVAIGLKACSFENVTVFDLGKYPKLKTLRIGNSTFSHVSVLNITGLSELESVDIGMNSFTKHKNTWEIASDPNRHFYLKNCPKLKSLKMGRVSFSDYKVVEIENVDALEVIEMGDLNEVSYSFKYASLELKSILIYRE